MRPTEHQIRHRVTSDDLHPPSRRRDPLDPPFDLPSLERRGRGEGGGDQSVGSGFGYGRVGSPFGLEGVCFVGETGVVRKV